MKKNYTEPKNKKVKAIKAWFVDCSKNLNKRAFTKRDAAKRHAVFLNHEYSGHCTHKIIPCEILLKEV